MDKRSMFYGAPPGIFGNAQSLRKKETATEKLLWTKLRNNQFLGLRFKRQHPISNFIADFYCHPRPWSVSTQTTADGQYHFQPDQSEYDENRNRIMFELGLSVLRFTDREVSHNIDGVLSKIESWIKESRILQ